MRAKRKRITMKLPDPNPLFVKWITEWRDKAREENSKMQYCFTKALTSLSKYPLPLERGRDCKILKGFGDKVCKMLDDKLKEHRKSRNVSVGDVPTSACDNLDEDESNTQNRKNSHLNPAADKSLKRKSCSREYIPKEGTGSYAILVTLYQKSLEPYYPGYLFKLEIIREAQHLSDTSFTRPDPGSRYTAWSSMGTLISKNLVEKKNHPPKFSLTVSGTLLARQLCNKGKNSDNGKNDVSCTFSNPSTNVHCDQVVVESSDEEVTVIKKQKTESDVSSKAIKLGYETVEGKCISARVPSSVEKYLDLDDLWNEECKGKTQSSSFVEESTYKNSDGFTSQSKTIQNYTSSSSIASSTQGGPEETFILSPETFDVILYVDTNETGGSNMDIRDDPILAELNFLSTPYAVKKLKVGDYAWICRDRATKNELVLPYIVERKRMDDFGKSIKDGRYHEQKFRLKRSGAQNITYLIESYGKNTHVGMPLPTLLQAATNTAIQDGFCIKFTENSKDTAKYLANFTSSLTNAFKWKTLVSCPKENLSEADLDDDLISLMTFKDFNRSSVKNKPMKASDLFVKMLVQIKGLSVDKALAIVQEYPTPETLRLAYKDNSGAKGEKLLEQIKFEGSSKSVGPVLSKIIYKLFTMQSF